MHACLFELQYRYDYCRKFVQEKFVRAMLSHHQSLQLYSPSRPHRNSNHAALPPSPCLTKQLASSFLSPPPLVIPSANHPIAAPSIHHHAVQIPPPPTQGGVHRSPVFGAVSSAPSPFGVVMTSPLIGSAPNHVALPLLSFPPTPGEPMTFADVTRGWSTVDDPTRFALPVMTSSNDLLASTMNGISSAHSNSKYRSIVNFYCIEY